MKKISAMFIFSGLVISAFAGQPQKRNFLLADDGEKCFGENTHVINIGIGAGTGYYERAYGETYRSSPYITLSYEQAWPKRIGPGYLGVGAYFGYRTEKYTRHYSDGFGNAYYYERRYSYYDIAGRAIYHWDVLNSKKAEVYGGVLVGITYFDYNYVDNDPSAAPIFVPVP